MKLLVVAMSESIHTKRWLDQIADQGWELHLFPSIDVGFARPDFKNITIHHSVYGRIDKSAYKSQKIKGISVYFTILSNIIRLPVRIFFPGYRAWQLKKLIKRLNPDIIHSLEIQQAGYLVDNVRKSWQGRFPKWIATNWGSDIYYFGRFPEHEKKIREVLEECDFYSCECDRDVCLAKKYGLRGVALPVFPCAGGFDLTKAKKLNSGRTSLRKKIALKGYHNWAGRALIALDALEKCKKLLNDYEIVVYSADDEVEKRVKLINDEGLLKITILPKNTDHDQILALHGSSRISIGLSISDAISTSLLEAMVMGSFPIQSNTACADEWITHSKSGFIVGPEDVDTLAGAIKRALKDDKLVDEAAKLNKQTAKTRLGYDLVKSKTIKMYKTVFDSEDGHYAKKS